MLMGRPAKSTATSSIGIWLPFSRRIPPPSRVKGRAISLGRLALALGGRGTRSGSQLGRSEARRSVVCKTTPGGGPMKRCTIVGIGLAIALSGCRGSTSEQEPVAGQAADKAMTVVGCLVPSAETPESRAVGTSSNPQPPSFTLVNVTTPVTGSAARSFHLVADEARLEDLQRFANSRVEVSGSVVASIGNGAAEVGAASAPAGGPPTDVRQLRVADVRQLESTCGKPNTK